MSEDKCKTVLHSKEKNMTDLRWIRVFTPDHVPHYLVEQIRDRDYTVDDFFRYHQIHCMMQGKHGIILNPFSHLYVLADPENQVKGFLWLSVNPISKDILIQTFSMHKDYWYKGEAVKKLADHVKEIREKAQLNKIFWVTKYEKHSMRYGFKRSKSILMEYNPEKEEKDGRFIIRGKREERGHWFTHPRTTTISEFDPGTGDIGTSGTSLPTAVGWD